MLTMHHVSVAEKFPSARVIGTDLSPIQPQWAPPNTEFRVEDLDDEHRPWSSIYAGADAIHTRALLPTLRNPKLMLRRAFEYAKWPVCSQSCPSSPLTWFAEISSQAGGWSATKSSAASFRKTAP